MRVGIVRRLPSFTPLPALAFMQMYSDSHASVLVAHEPTREYGPIHYHASNPAPEPAPAIRAWLDAGVQPIASSVVLHPAVDGDEVSIPETRVLALLVQSDPVLLARVLCLANGIGPRRDIDTADEALRIVTPAVAARAMRALTPIPSTPPWGGAAPVRDALLGRCVAMALTARRLARYLGMSRIDATMSYLAALLDGFGLLSIVASDPSMHAALFTALRDATRPPGTSLRDAPALAGYWAISAQIARRWDAPQAVIDALDIASSEAGQLVHASDALIAAKAARRSQRDALEQLLPGARHADAGDAGGDIDVAFLPDH